MEERCFAETLSGGCSALTTKVCETGKCSFYKTIAEAQMSYRRAQVRCKRLNIPANEEYVIWRKAKDLAEQIEEN